MAIQFETGGLQNVRRYDRSGRDVARATSELGQVIGEESNDTAVADMQGNSDADTSLIGLLGRAIGSIGRQPRETAAYLRRESGSTAGATIDTMDPGAAAADEAVRGDDAMTAVPAGPGGR